MAEQTEQMSDTPYSWNSACITDVGKVRKLNEDSALDRGADGIWVVADGMGGHSAGDLASQMIVNSIEKMEVCDDLAELVDRVDDTVVKVNERLFQVSSAHNQTSGSTIVALVARGRHVVTMWAGDSRLYRLRDGSLAQMTTDHTQIEMYIEKGLVNRSEAEGHPSSNMVTRAVGVTDNLVMEMDIFELAAGDRFLLCSDGLDKHVKDPEIEQILASGEPDEIVRQLVELTLERGASDNVTVCVVDIVGQ